MDISKLFGSARFFAFAQSLDEQLADDLKQKGCPFCGGALHFSCYQRKSRSPFDIPLPERWDTFFSLCCAKEGCRRRSRPLSIRYAGRSPHSAGVLLLCNLLHTGGAQRAIVALCKELMVSERTVRRWLRFWKTTCLRTKWWRELAGRFSLSGSSIINVFENLMIKNPIQLSCEIIAKETMKLWPEIRLNSFRKFFSNDFSVFSR